MQSNTVLYLHGPLVRTSRLLLEGLSAFAAQRGWNVQRASPPHGAGSDYLRDLAEFWNPVGFVEDCSITQSIPFPDASTGLPVVFVDLDETKRGGVAGWPSPPAKTGRRPTTKAAGSPLVGFVDSDSESMARLAARELLRHDFASYGYVSAYHPYHWSDVRRHAFREEIAQGGGGTVREFDAAGLSTGSAAGVRRLGAWLRSLPKPCGVLAANDRTASLVLTAAERHGVTVPDEAGIIGIDDDEMLCENMSPPLTSIRADFVLGGRLAGRLLADLVEGAARSGASLRYGEQRVVQRLSVRKLLRPAPSVRKVLETIRRRATEGISASDILPMLGGSRRSAEKRFRAATGKSILEEILDVRFEKLLPLLERGHLPLGTLAGLAGFSSENHLQRQFKARYGMTLSAWRKRHLG